MSGTDIRVVQELLGHSDVSTTMIYTHVLGDPEHEVVSPLDALDTSGASGAGGTTSAEHSRDLVEQEEQSRTVAEGWMRWLGESVTGLGMKLIWR